MAAKVASGQSSMSTPPPKKKRGGFFSCRSKHALDSLPRNARGEKAAIHQIQARNIFEHLPQASESTTTTAAPTPLTEEKGQLKLAELNSAASAQPQPVLEPVKQLYAQEVFDENAPVQYVERYPQPEPEVEEVEAEEARDAVPEDVAPMHGVSRSMSVASKSGRIVRSLSLKRSASTASARLIARAPPVSSADFANLPEASGSSDHLAQEEEQGSGDMAAIKKARGRHGVIGANGHRIPDISEDLDFENVPIPPTTVPKHRAERSGSSTASGSTTPLKKRAMAVDIPESDSMRAVAAALEGSTDSFRFQPGPSVGTPRLEPASPTKDAYIAEIRSQQRSHGSNGSEDTVSDLPPPAFSPSRNFWDASPTMDDFARVGKPVPFQYVTNLSRPVSIASFRSLATPSTPPRTSSRPTSPNGTYSGAGLRSTKSFSVSPLQKQATFNGFPRAFFPASTLKHSPSVASAHRKPVPEISVALDFDELQARREARRIQRETERSERSQRYGYDEEEEEEGDGDTSADDVERQLTGGHVATRSHACSNCGVEEPRDFAAFVAKGKASRRTSVKQQTIGSPSGKGSVRKSKSKTDTAGESTLKRWGLAEAFKSSEGQEVKQTTVKKQKKMVPGPGGGYITETANVRWCSALDEIKKALADDKDENEQKKEGDDDEEEERVQKETQMALRQADDVLTRLGVAM